MLTGELRNQVDRIWDAFWSGGIANPLEVIEQITYLLFLRRLDEQQQLEENKAARLGKPIERRLFPAGKDARGRPHADLRWSRFKNFAPAEMYTVVAEHVFPFLRPLGGDGSTYAHHMKDARFTIPTPALLAKVVDLIDQVPMTDRDTKGDIYEYMLGKIATAGQNGQFRTPRHIIRLMVELTAPGPKDVICDPACGTCGFLVAAGEHLRERHPEILRDPDLRAHFHGGLFHGFDFDNTMLRIGSMNMLLHGVESPDVRYRDSLAQDHAGEDEKYTLVLANPPFAGSLDYENVAKDLLQIVKTKKTELLFLTLFLRLLKPGGRAAVIVPDGVLFGSSKAHKELRRLLVEDQKLEGVIALPAGVFKPYSGVSTAILLFTKTNSGGTDAVWFYDCLDTLTQSIFLDMFGGHIWPSTALGELVREFRYGTSTKSRSIGVPALRIPNVIAGMIDVSDLKLVPVEDKEFSRLRLIDGDLLFVRTNGNREYVGRCAVFSRDSVSASGFSTDAFVFASYLIRARLRSERSDPTYVREFFLGSEGRRQLLSHAKTSAGQFNINTESLGAMSVPNPPLELQREFAGRVRAVEGIKTAHRASLAKLDELFASLQHRAFRGEL